MLEYYDGCSMADCLNKIAPKKNIKEIEIDIMNGTIQGTETDIRSLKADWDKLRGILNK